MRVILFIEGERSSGGAEKIGFTTARLLIESGAEVHIVSSAAKVVEDIPGATFHCLNLPFVWDSFFARGKVQMLKTLLKDSDRFAIVSRLLAEIVTPETVIHFHGYHNHFSFAAVDAALATRRPVFVTAHDYAYACPGTTFFNYPESKICELKPLSIECLKSRCVSLESNHYKMLRFFQLYGARKRKQPERLAGLFTVSTFEQDILKGMFSDEVKMSVLPNPIPMAQTQLLETSVRKGYLWVGRITKEKNLEVALEATASAGVSLTVIGEGPEKEDLLSRYPSANFLGWKTEAEIHDAYKSHRALLLTSAWYETASLVTLEAFAHGMPVIVPRRNAARSWIPEVTDQLNFDPSSSQELEQNIRRLENDEELRSFSQTAYDLYWSSPYSEEQYLQRLTEHYQGALSK